jgi:hypothetical protein
VAQRISTSIVLLSALLAGTIAPTGVCAFMCERRSRAESRRHCGESRDAMPGMAHDHSAMNHPSLEAMSAAFASQSCSPNCAPAERLTFSRNIAYQVTVVKTAVVIPDTAAQFLPPDPTGAFSSDGGPPVPPTALTASFSVLRI